MYIVILCRCLWLLCLCRALLHAATLVAGWMFASRRTKPSEGMQLNELRLRNNGAVGNLGQLLGGLC
jgi:hypothetical protein